MIDGRKFVINTLISVKCEYNIGDSFMLSDVVLQINNCCATVRHEILRGGGGGGLKNTNCSVKK